MKEMRVREDGVRPGTQERVRAFCPWVSTGPEGNWDCLLMLVERG